MINGWECRFDPQEPDKNPKYDATNVTPITTEAVPAWFDGNVIDLPMMFPNLRFIVGACGTKFGKTFGCATRFVKEGWLNAGSLNWWVAPSYDQCEMAMEEVKKRIPDPGLMHEQMQKHRITLLNPDGTPRSVFQFKSGDDPDLLRGAKVNFFVIDEAARGMPYESFKSVFTTVTQTYGRGIIISTPNGLGWFYDLYCRGDKQLNPDEWPEWYSLRMPTWVNPTVPIKSVLDAKSNMSEDSFKQEYAAEFLDQSAGVFRSIENNAVLVPLLMEPNRCIVDRYHTGHHYVVGVDLARKRDYTVLTVFDATTRKVVYWERFNQIDWPFQYYRIVAVAKEFRAVISIDATGLGDVIAQTLMAAGCPVEPYTIGGSNSKRQLIENLKINMEQGLIQYPNVPVMIDELRRFQYKQTASGTIQYEAPEGFHDDCVLSLALAVWLGAQQPWVYRYYNFRGV